MHKIIKNSTGTKHRCKIREVVILRRSSFHVGLWSETTACWQTNTITWYKYDWTMTCFMVKFFSYKPHSLSCLQSDPKKTSSYLEHLLSTWWDLRFLRPFAASDLHDPAGAAPPGTCRSRHPPHAPSGSQGGSCSERVWRDEAAPAGLGASGSLGNSAGPCDPAPPGHWWWKSRVRYRAKWPCRKKKDWVHLRWCHTWVPILLPRRYSTTALSDLNEGHWLENKKKWKKKRKDNWVSRELKLL